VGVGLPELIDATEVARRLDVDRTWVYERADELGAIRLGDGKRPRLRFNPSTVYEALAARPAPAKPERAKARRTARTSTVPLLPVKGE